MDLSLSETDRAFRDEARAFVLEALPVATRAKVLARRRLAKDDYVTWHRILAAKGWIAPSWPIARGGTTWTPLQKHLFDEVCWELGAPPVQPPGVKLVAPVLMRFGSAAQQDAFLPRIYDGTDFWCQGYSEPGAGSDLASLSTKAVVDGDAYVVDGQKTWITLAQWADWMFMLVRTSTGARRQEGITFLLVDMRSPGITVRPIATLDGEHEVNEVFFDAVRVPVAQRVGEQDRGWACAKVLLGHERTAIAGVARSKRDLRWLKRVAAAERRGDRTLLCDPLFAHKVARVEAALMALEITVLRVIVAEQGRVDPGPEASMLKVQGSEIRQRITELLLEAAGPQSLPCADAWLASAQGARPLVATELAPIAAYHFNSRKNSIFGGTNEVQKNLVAATVLER